MIEPQHSFAQLQKQPLSRVELIGIVGGVILDEINPPGVSFVYAPHGDDVLNDVSLDARVIVHKAGNFGNETIQRLMSAKQLGNRILIVGSYTPQERGYDRIDAETVEIQLYS
jgi:hypothetical protein